MLVSFVDTLFFNEMVIHIFHICFLKDSGKSSHFLNLPVIIVFKLLHLWLQRRNKEQGLFYRS